MKQLERRGVKQVAAIILAAGRSQRMGEFKPLLPFGATTVIGACIEYLQAGDVENIVVVAGHRAEELEAHLRHAKVVFTVNPDPNGDMTSSIACGVNQLPLETSAVLITPADYPAVPSKVVRQLIEHWRKGHFLIKPTWQGQGGHPVLIDMRFRDELTHLDSNRGLRSFFETHAEQVERLPVESRCVARDIDTWDDYTALHVEVFGKLPPSAARR